MGKIQSGESSLPSEEDSWNDRLLYRVKTTVQKAVGIPTQPLKRPTIVAPNVERALYSSIRQLARNRISVALQQLRAQHGLSYEQIQQQTGLSQQLLWDIEFSDRRLSLDELRQLLSCYDISVNDILGVDVDTPKIDKMRIRDHLSNPLDKGI